MTGDIVCARARGARNKRPAAAQRMRFKVSPLSNCVLPPKPDPSSGGALIGLGLNVQDACVSRGRQIQTRRIDLQVQRIGARPRIGKENEKGLVEKRDAASRGHRTGAREGSVASSVEAPGNTRRWDVIAGPVGQCRRRVGKVCVFDDVAEDQRQSPTRNDGDGRASSRGTIADEIEIHESGRRGNGEAAAQDCVEIYRGRVGIQLSAGPTGAKSKDDSQQYEHDSAAC
jgi:hypothetical protein